MSDFMAKMHQNLISADALSETDCLTGKGSEGDMCPLPVCEVRIKLGISSIIIIWWQQF